MGARQSIIDAIYKALPDLPPNQKKIAEFFLENLQIVALIPIKQVAEQAGVSEASIVRFAQALGYKGYKELKDEVSLALQNQLSPTERYQKAVSTQQTKSDVTRLVADNVINNIHDTLDSLESSTFSNVVDAIISARRIHCMGLELSFHFSKMLTFMLRLYGYDAHTLAPEFLRFNEQIAYLSEEDLLIAFSFSPYSRETVEAVQFARDKGLDTVAFTDKKLAPMRDIAQHCIQIKTDNIMFSNSLGAVSVVLNAIMTELNFRDKDRTLKALKIIEDNIKDERYFIY